MFFIKSKSVLNKSKLYNNNSFEQINNLYKNKTQLKNIFISLNNVPDLKVIKHDNNYSIILSINSYFLSSKKIILRKIVENDIEKMDESDDTNEDSESNEEIFDEIKNNVSEYYNNNSNIQNVTIIKFSNNTSSSSDFF